LAFEAKAEPKDLAIKVKAKDFIFETKAKGITGRPQGISRTPSYEI